jgi:hypothetical protein
MDSKAQVGSSEKAFVLWENGSSLYVGFEGDCKPLGSFFTCH